MKTQKMHVRIFFIVGIFLLTTNTFAQDPNFYIFLCFGQSNMEGQGTIETQDESVDSRFQVLQAIDCSNLGKSEGTWYTATPPLCRCYTKLSPVDYFGRTLIENLSSDIKVGVVHVAVSGCKIELFDKDDYADYVSTVESWMKTIIDAYDGNPYAYLVEMAKLAQQDGVIKGILLHQGESNTGDSDWPTKVKNIYNDLISDLDLDAASVPLLAGEVVHEDQGGSCASMNSIIAQLPETLSNSYVISSSGCTAQSDNLHFNSAGYRELGTRYANKMLSLLSDDGTSDEYSITVNARGTDGSEQITLSVGGTSVQTWTLGTSLADYTATTSLSGNIRVELINDNGTGRDVQVDYIEVGGTTLQAEAQETNTGVWQNSSCGGEYSEWLHCDGYIEFDAFKNASTPNMDNEPTNSSISFYPNPVNNILNVVVPNQVEQAGVLSIYSANGKLIRDVQVEKGENSIPVNDLGAGLYIIKLNIGEQVSTGKFMKAQ